mmetsp:Transcript_17630/g.38548  ORF Transcript_17630/g.38548 Transcript_17630/m.38548 type:complete len:264 (+) Transcript_17630:1373-2164(+)
MDHGPALRLVDEVIIFGRAGEEGNNTLLTVAVHALPVLVEAVPNLALGDVGGGIGRVGDRLGFDVGGPPEGPLVRGGLGGRSGTGRAITGREGCLMSRTGWSWRDLARDAVGTTGSAGGRGIEHTASSYCIGSPFLTCILLFIRRSARTIVNECITPSKRRAGTPDGGTAHIPTHRHGTCHDHRTTRIGLGHAPSGKLFSRRRHGTIIRSFRSNRQRSTVTVGLLGAFGRHLLHRPCRATKFHTCIRTRPRIVVRAGSCYLFG